MKVYEQAGEIVSFNAARVVAEKLQLEFAYKIVNFSTDKGPVDMLEINPVYESVRYRINGLYYFEHELVLVHDQLN
jgi:hypothetical protein